MLTVELATAADAATILGLRHAAEDWLFAREIDQWTPREVPLSTVVAHIEAGEFYVARRDPSGPIVGALRLIWADPTIWPEEDGLAGYVHGLVIDRSEAGTGRVRFVVAGNGNAISESDGKSSDTLRGEWNWKCHEALQQFGSCRANGWHMRSYESG